MNMTKLNSLIKVAMVATGIAACAAQARAVNVSYVDVDGTTKQADAAVVTRRMGRVAWSAGWYVVTNAVEFNGGAYCSGEVHLILADTGKLTITGVADFNAGIAVSGDNDSLAIYGQKLGTGALEVKGGGNGAGIGGSNLDGAGSNITINGGTVTATGGSSGAGIGGGNGKAGSDITINGGTVTATGGSSGAGIGGGSSGTGSKIRINGGTVMAKGGSIHAAGIGNGEDATTAASEIYAAADVIVKAGASANPTDEIAHTAAQDIAGFLEEKRYVTAVKPNPTITGVTARQRYPWNGKVDIEYTASDLVAATEGKELVPAIKVLSVDRATTPWTTNYADSSCLFVGPSGKKALTDAEATKDGTHQIVWDMDKQGLSFVSTNVIFAVLGEGKKLGGVQLWEDGPYWAECNVGAAQPQDYGYYFWWGDTVGYKRNAANNGWVSVEDGVTAFTFAAGNCGTYQKDNAALKTAGYIDDTGNLVAAHDAATKHLGAPWRMPTDAEMTALKDNCSRIWTGDWNGTGVAGYVVTGKGDYASKSIFLPAAGYGYGSDLDRTGSDGSYWSSTPTSDHSSYAWFLNFFPGYFLRDGNYRYNGQSVRPVRGSAK